MEGTEVNVGGHGRVLYLGEEPDRLKRLLSRLARQTEARAGEL